MIESLQTIVKAQPFFAGIDDEAIDFIVGCARNVRFESGDFLFREAQAADSFYLIRSGRVALTIHGAQHGTHTIQTIGPGEMCGWSWLIPPYRARLDARALESTRALQFDASCLRKKCEDNPAIGFELAKRVGGILAKRLDNTRLQLLDIYGSSGAAR